MSELDKYINSSTKQYTALYKKIASRLKDELQGAGSEDVNGIISDVWEEFDVPQQYRDILLEGLLGATKVGLGAEEYKASSVAFHGYYEDLVSVGKYELSKQIHDVTRVDEIQSLIKNSMKTQQTINTMAVDLVKKDITTAQLPKYMDDLVSKFRQASALTGDKEAFLKYRKSIAKANSQIENLKSSNDTSALARAYRDISELSLNASDSVVEKTIDRAIMVKARSNALRLAHTETARAYGDARVDSVLADSDANAIQVVLSGDHDGYCICDFFAESDMYGLGAGIYPKNELPEYPFHPYCQCMLDPVYGDESPKYDDERAKSGFDNLGEDEKQALVGSEGSWDDLDWKDHKVSKEFPSSQE
jgi:hypothetical protein